MQTQNSYFLEPMRRRRFTGSSKRLTEKLEMLIASNEAALDKLIENHVHFKLARHLCFDNNKNLISHKSLPWLMPVKNSINLKMNAPMRKKYEAAIQEKTGMEIPEGFKYNKLIMMLCKNGYVDQAVALIKKDEANALIEDSPPKPDDDGDDSDL